MSDTDDQIITEPPDPLAGADDSVAKVGQRLQEEADAADADDTDVSDDMDEADVANGEG